MIDEHDFDRTRVIGERALAYLKEFVIPPDPRNYALLYHHTAGHDRVLSDAVSRAVQDNGRLTAADARRLRDSFLDVNSALPMLQDGLNGHADALAEIVDDACDSAIGFGATLTGAEEGFRRSDSGEDADCILRDLMQASADMARHNQALEQQLQSSRREIEALRQKIDTVRRRSEADSLTGLPQRHAFRNSVAEALKSAHRRGAPLSLLIADIDGFASYNKAHGSQVADKILKFVAGMIVEMAGAGSTVARYGGDQIAVLLPDFSLESALKLAERIRANVEAKKFVRKSSGRSVGCVTLSIGAALYGYGDGADALIDRALECLRTAKRLGRNRVRSAANSDGFARANGPDEAAGEPADA
jgi:diguanylate cyclase